MSAVPTMLFASRFELGETVMTRGIYEMCQEEGFDPGPYMFRHSQCDWSDMCEEDQETNRNAVEKGGRVFSSFDLPEGSFGETKVWVITEADRSVTTVLLPSEY